MNPEEIRAEIEKRRNQARDMKLREKVWELYNSNFQYIDTHLKEDPNVVLPEIRQSLARSGDSSKFKFKEQTYTLVCQHGKEETDRYRGDDSTTTPMTFKLKVNGELVFEFSMRQTITYGTERPDFYESFGNISAFIEGPWTEVIGELHAAMWATGSKFIRIGMLRRKPRG